MAGNSDTLDALKEMVIIASGDHLSREELDLNKEFMLDINAKLNEYQRPSKEQIKLKDGRIREVKLLYNTKKGDIGTMPTSTYKTTMCHYQIGKCPYGHRCRFAHSREELQKYSQFRPFLEEFYNVAKNKHLDPHGEPCVNQQCPIRLRLLLKNTVICQYWTENQCVKSDARCSYAHGEKQLVPMPKYELCKNFQNKRCSLKDTECVYAHGWEELRQRGARATAIKPPMTDVTQVEAVSLKKRVSRDSGSDNNEGEHDHSVLCKNQQCSIKLKLLLKNTAICKYWIDGKCPYTDTTCVYAHGGKQLMPLPKYELCTKFLSGDCNITNNQCVYAHRISELKQKRPTPLQSSSGDSEEGSSCSEMNLSESNYIITSRSMSQSCNNLRISGDSESGSEVGDTYEQGLCQNCQLLHDQIPEPYRKKYFI